VNCVYNNEYRGRDPRQQSAAVDPVMIVRSTYTPIISIQYDVLSYIVSSCVVVVVWVYNKDAATLWSCVCVIDVDDTVARDTSSKTHPADADDVNLLFGCIMLLCYVRAYYNL